jgi:hypothetical protein
MAWLSHLQDGIAVFDKICDDLEDLSADLDAGRYTWVANVLIAATPGEVIPPQECARRLAEGLMRSDREGAVLATLRRTAQQAAEVVPASAPPRIHDLVGALHSRVSSIEQALHTAKVHWVFGNDVQA